MNPSVLEKHIHHIWIDDLSTVEKDCLGLIAENHSLRGKRTGGEIESRTCSASRLARIAGTDCRTLRDGVGLDREIATPDRRGFVLDLVNNRDGSHCSAATNSGDKENSRGTGIYRVRAKTRRLANWSGVLLKG